MVPSKKNCVTCPKCKRVYKLPGGGAVTDLPTNNFALCILQLLNDRRSWWFIHSNRFIIIISSSISNTLNLISQFLVFDLWRCAWAKLPRFPPHRPGQEQGRGWTVRPASGWCHIFERRRDSAGAIPIEPPTGTWRTAGKGEGSRVADGREQQSLEAKAIDGEELGCNQEPVSISEPRLHFVQEEP